MHIPSLFVQKRTGHVYELLSLRTDLSGEADFTGIEMCSLRRLGDNAAKEFSSTRMQDKFDQLTTEEVQMVLTWQNQHPPTARQVLKYAAGTLQYISYVDPKPASGARVQQELNSLAEQAANILTVVAGGKLIIPEERDGFHKLIVAESVRDSLQEAVAKWRLNDFIYNQWNLKSVDSQERKSVINLFGPPGTGKTLAARALAKELGKKLLQVDYAQLESKWVGETGKNIQKIFEYARKHDTMIFLDEADTLASARVESENSPQASYHNNNRNVFLQELDQFNGSVVMTTNLFKNFDSALLRRISHHVKFELPTASMRAQLFKDHVPAAVPATQVNWSEVVQASENLSGGDIKNVCVDGIVAAALAAEQDLASAQLTTQHLLTQIHKIKQAQAEHRGEINRRPLGFSP